MKLLIRVATFVAVVAVAVFALGFLLPDRVEVERSTTIAAPPAAVFGIVNGFTRFAEWSPWQDLDPDMTTTRSGPDMGVGARYEWRGNSKAGAGVQEIIESVPDESVTIKLQFEGFDQPSMSMMRLAPVAGGTQVVWQMYTDTGGEVLNRYFGLLMKKFVGNDYEKGLARLKALVEAEPVAAPAADAPTEPAVAEPPATDAGG